MHIVVGSYERFLLGYQVPESLHDQGVQLKRAFTYAAHQGPVRCICSAGGFVVSGGQDDQLHIYDVQHGRDLGFLVNPGDGAITCITLFASGASTRPTHMFSGSADGSIAIWKAGGEWEHLKLMKGHKSSVNSLAVHPSGRLALSVAHDRALRMWDLTKGRCTYTTPLEAEADVVSFSPSGEAYTVVSGTRLSVHSVSEAGGPAQQLTTEHKVLCLLQQQEHLMLAGLENGSMVLWDVRSSSPQAQLQGHKTRIRAMVAVTPDPQAALPHHFASASSDGVVKLWDARMLSSSGEMQEVATVETQARITCMCTSPPAPRGPARAGSAAKKHGGEEPRKAEGHSGDETKPGHKQKPQQQQQQQEEEEEDKQGPPLWQGAAMEQAGQPSKSNKRDVEQQIHPKPPLEAGRVKKKKKKDKRTTQTAPVNPEALVAAVGNTLLMKKRKQKALQRSTAKPHQA